MQAAKTLDFRRTIPNFHAKPLHLLHYCSDSLRKPVRYGRIIPYRSVRFSLVRSPVGPVPPSNLTCIAAISQRERGPGGGVALLIAWSAGPKGECNATSRTVAERAYVAVPEAGLTCHGISLSSAARVRPKEGTDKHDPDILLGRMQLAHR